MTIKCDNYSSDLHLLECLNYHLENHKRRNPFSQGRLVYSSEICLDVEKTGFCSSFDKCNKSHNIYEILYHPEKYKTILCEQKHLLYFKFCPFAHSNDQLRNGKCYEQVNKLSLYNTISQENNSENNLNNVFMKSNTEFEILSFKTQVCLNNSKHNEKQCVFYHSSKDRRRPIKTIIYSSDLCKFIEENKECPYKEMCSCSHNRVEQFYHPEKFKSKYCSHLGDNIGLCPYGNYCCFAHYDDEITIELIHKLSRNHDFYLFYFKTIWCPFNNQHDKSSCIYAHNWQDFRRCPINYNYTETLCNQWDIRKTILNYYDGCKNEYRCSMSHGWKEQDYHYNLFKTKKCKFYNSSCKKQKFCPFFHKNELKRTINEDEKRKIKKKIEIKQKEKEKSNQIKNINEYYSASSKNHKNNKSDIITNKYDLNTSGNNFNISNFNQSYKGEQINNSMYENRINDYLSSSSNNSGNYSLKKKQSVSPQSSCSDIIEENNNDSLLYELNTSKEFTNQLQKIFSSQQKESKLIKNLITDKNTNVNHFVNKNYDKSDYSDYESEVNSSNFFPKKNEENFMKNYQSTFFSNNTTTEKYNEQLLHYLRVNGFENILKKINTNELTIQELMIMEEISLKELIENDNLHKFYDLKKFIINLDDAFDCDDLLKKIENFQGKILLN